MTSSQNQLNNVGWVRPNATQQGYLYHQREPLNLSPKYLHLLPTPQNNQTLELLYTCLNILDYNGNQEEFSYIRKVVDIISTVVTKPVTKIFRSFNAIELGKKFVKQVTLLKENIRNIKTSTFDYKRKKDKQM